MDFLPACPAEPADDTPENMLISFTLPTNKSIEVINWLIQNRIPFSCFQKQSNKEVDAQKSAVASFNTMDQITITPKDEKINAVIKTLYGQITSHISAKIPSFGDIEANFNIDPIKFKAVFKNMYQLPFHQYFMKHKMGQARELLESGEFSVKQVSEMLGYANSVKFVTVFKKYQNVTPGTLKTIARTSQILSK